MWWKRGYSELPVVTTGSHLGFRVLSRVSRAEDRITTAFPPEPQSPKASVTTPSCVQYARNLFFKMSAEQLLMLKCGCRDPEVSHHFFQEIKSSVNKIKNVTAVYKIIVLPRKTTVPRSDVLLHL